jgi:hypothetical protein
MPENEEMQEEQVRVPSGDDQLEFNLGDDEQGAEVVLSDDGKAEVKPLDAAGNEENSSTTPEKQGQEHEEYSTKVKKRLDKMTAKLREAERREQAALEYAKQIQANLATMQSRVQSLDQGFITESKGRIDSQLAIAEANLQDAVERGDGKAVVEAQKLLSQLVLQQDKLNYVASQRQQQAAAVPQTPPPLYQQPPQQPYQQPQPRVDSKAEAWAEENEWFGEDLVMTNGAYAIHGQLAQEGFDLSSDEYYDELNRRIRKEFPHKFKKPQANTNIDAPGVAPATRGTTVSQNGRRSIKLTPSEVAIARKLGVPLEEYAKYVRR